MKKFLYFSTALFFIVVAIVLVISFKDFNFESEKEKSAQAVNLTSADNPALRVFQKVDLALPQRDIPLYALSEEATDCKETSIPAIVDEPESPKEEWGEEWGEEDKEDSANDALLAELAEVMALAQTEEPMAQEQAESCWRCQDTGRCPACYGRGDVRVQEVCSRCQGSGRINLQVDYCYACYGRGYLETWERCSTCGGTGRCPYCNRDNSKNSQTQPNSQSKPMKIPTSDEEVAKFLLQDILRGLLY